MGQVHEVGHSDGRTGAIEALLRPSARQLERLRREARTLAQLDHPGIVQLLDVIEDDEQCFLAMELVRGPTLNGWARGSPRDLATSSTCSSRSWTPWAPPTGGWIHRDLEPSYVLVDESARPHWGVPANGNIR